MICKAYYNLILIVFFLISSVYAQAPVNDSVADAILVTNTNYTDLGVNVYQAAQILEGTDCSIRDNPSSPFPAVLYKFELSDPGDVTVNLVSPSGTSTINFYTADDLNATTGSDLTKITTCTVRTSITNNCSAGQAYYVSVVNTGGSTDISISSTATLLPVELVSFTAQRVNSSVKLNWETATEINNYGFEIQRKNNDTESEWEIIDFVAGSGNSNSPKTYEFIDENPPLGDLEYRLKQMDTDGEYEYFGPTAHVGDSNTETIQNIQLPENFALFQNYPNPFNPTTKIKYGLPEVSNVKLEVYNSIGERVSLLVNSENKNPGIYSVNWNAANLASGIYFVRLEVLGNESHQNHVLVNKAALLK